MAIEHSDAEANAVLNTGFKGTFDTTGEIDVFTGAAPGPNNASTGTLLATLALASTSFGTAASRVDTAAAISSATASATGTAGYFRVRLSGDLNSDATGTKKRIEGTVGTSGSDMNLNSTAITSGGNVSISLWQYTFPA